MKVIRDYPHKIKRLRNVYRKHITFKNSNSYIVIIINLYCNLRAYLTYLTYIIIKIRLTDTYN